MESPSSQYPEIEKETGEDSPAEIAERVAGMYIHAAEQYLEEGDQLRERIVRYYEDRPETHQELLNFMKNKGEHAAASLVRGVEGLVSDRAAFIEQMERLYELQDVHRTRRELGQSDRLATEEEYKLGAYADLLESQVGDAVFAVQKKGYLAFQSGFSRTYPRDQFMDFYNGNIALPESAHSYLESLSIEVRVEQFDDRTTLTLHPVGSEPVRLAAWKEIWDTLAGLLPQADPTLVPNMPKATQEHVDFRKKQNALRRA